MHAVQAKVCDWKRMELLILILMLGWNSSSHGQGLDGYIAIASQLTIIPTSF